MRSRPSTSPDGHWKTIENDEGSPPSSNTTLTEDASPKSGVSPFGVAPPFDDVLLFDDAAPLEDDVPFDDAPPSALRCGSCLTPAPLRPSRAAMSAPTLALKPSA